jgi:hypothetical protein
MKLTALLAIVHDRVPVNPVDQIFVTLEVPLDRMRLFGENRRFFAHEQKL